MFLRVLFGGGVFWPSGDFHRLFIKLIDAEEESPVITIYIKQAADVIQSLSPDVTSLVRSRCCNLKDRFIFLISRCVGKMSSSVSEDIIFSCQLLMRQEHINSRYDMNHHHLLGPASYRPITTSVSSSFKHNFGSLRRRHRCFVTTSADNPHQRP